MNERIKELAEQATSIVESPPNREGWTSSYAYFDKEKFAELIVRECMNIAKNWQDQLENANSLSESNAVGIVAYRIARQF
mgnify:CR=1 FL=1